MLTTSTKAVGWGIMGCGWIATEAIAPAIGWSKNGRLVAVASRDMSAAQAKARETGAERAYSPYEAMLADPDIQAVYIGLPNGLHEEWAIRCAKAGKHVLCEKSLALSVASAQRIVAAFAAIKPTKLRLVEAFMYRHHPQWPVVRGLLGEGAIGTTRIVRGSFCSRFEKPADHRWSAALGGGALWDLTCYAVDAARYVTGAEPLRALAIADTRTSAGVDASSQASLEFGGGILVSATGSLRSGRDQSLTLIGDEGAIQMSAPFAPGWAPTHIEVRRRDGVRTIEVPGANHFLHQVEHFADLVLHPERDPFPAEDGLRNVAACAAIETSWRSGASVAVGF